VPRPSRAGSKIVGRFLQVVLQLAVLTLRPHPRIIGAYELKLKGSSAAPPTVLRTGGADRLRVAHLCSWYAPKNSSCGVENGASAQNRFAFEHLHHFDRP
jgi:hypothetical protein